jgi:hypothetical protein
MNVRLKVNNLQRNAPKLHESNTTSIKYVNQSLSSNSFSKTMTWKTDMTWKRVRVTWQMESKVSKMMFGHPLRETKSKNKIAKRAQIQKRKIEPKNIFFFLFL